MGTPLPCHFESGQRIYSKELLIDCPVENAAEDAQIPIDGRVLDRLIPASPGPPEFFSKRFCDSENRKFREERQQELGVVEVVRTDGTVRDESCDEFVEGHRGIGLDDLESPIVQFLLECVFDFLCTLAVGRSGGLLIPDAIVGEIGPIHLPALQKTHEIFPPFCWRASSQRMTWFS